MEIVIDVLIGEPIFSYNVLEVAYFTMVMSCFFIVLLNIIAVKIGIDESNISHDDPKESDKKFDLFSAILIEPILEEILFRSILMQGSGIIISSILFGLMHYNSKNTKCIQPVYATVMGLYLCFVFLCFGLVGSVLAHIWFNFFGTYIHVRRINQPTIEPSC